MALKYSKKKNLIRSPDEYTRYYGDFRGVDFSSDHTNVHDQRLAYAINMYKDYRAGEGNAIETIPGYRRRFQAPRSVAADGTVTYEKINGIHEFQYINLDGGSETDVFVHAGHSLYLWSNYPNSVNVILSKTYAIPKTLNIALDFEVSDVVSIKVDSAVYTDKFSFSGGILRLDEFFADKVNSLITINYYEAERTKDDRLNTDDLSDHESKSFVFNNRLYIMDGTNYLVLLKEGGEYAIKKVTSQTAEIVPTVYANIPIGDLAPEDMSEYEYEQKNLLGTKYKHTYVAGTTTNAEGSVVGVTDYPLYDNEGDVVSVTVYGEDAEYEVEDDYIKFAVAPDLPINKGYPEYYAGVEVTYQKTEDKASSDSSMIEKCTVCATFDKRVFVTGNPNYPNRIWYCGYNAGYEDATYFGELDYVDDGVENAPITGLIPVADTLAAVKNNTRQDGSVYFHKRMETNEQLIPVTYPSEPGLSGIGCLGACVNFLDDPVFVSRLGIEAIGQLSVRLERAIEHRSSLIDAKIVNLDLDNAKLAEWGGYLLVLVDGKIFMADSRQRYTHDSGVMQYEWYYLENIGIYEGQYEEYYYAPVLYDFLPQTIEYEGEKYPVSLADSVYNIDRMVAENLTYSPVKVDSDDESTRPTIISIPYSDDEFTYTANYVLKRTWDGKSYTSGGNHLLVTKAILCENRGSYTGGTFYPAKTITSFNDNIFFGTDNGIVCSFNFDKRQGGVIAPMHYSFDNRTIYCGIATKMDNCGVPHLTKSTIKKSTVIKTKSMQASIAKIKIRTNKKAYSSLARVNSRIFDFDDIDFSEFTFVSDDQSIFAIKEKEKHWVEKQHWIYSDEIFRPLSINYVAFRYKISGRIKG